MDGDSRDTQELEFNGLGSRTLLTAFAILCFTSMLVGAKIFLTTEIYRSSRTINSLASQNEALLEEKKQLEKELEVVRSRYLIANFGD